MLEVGTGSGYTAAVLSELCAEVFSVEIGEELALKTRTILAAWATGACRFSWATEPLAGRSIRLTTELSFLPLRPVFPGRWSNS